MDGRILSKLTVRLTALQARIAAACYRAGRDPNTVTLLPVSKNFGSTYLHAATELGLHRFAENRVHEIRDKAEAWTDGPIAWVMVGPVQTNKSKEVVKWVSEVQSLDRLTLAQALERRLQQAGRSLEVLIQVKTSNEPSKHGLRPEDLPGFLQALAAYKSLHVRGLMTLAVHSQDTVAIRTCFRQLRQCRDRLREANLGSNIDLTRLSMGMSHDFEIAIEEGATEVRIGRALFAGIKDED